MRPLYRNALPQLDGRLYVTDGGIETSLIFHEGIELPDFAAFDLFKRPGGEAALRKYFRNYARIAARFKAGLILESATWRASADWGLRLGYAPPTWKRSTGARSRCSSGSATSSGKPTPSR